jgi:hypothetical protein
LEKDKMNQETPDNWIERQPIDEGPQHEDACPVCDKIDCECPPESIEPKWCTCGDNMGGRPRWKDEHRPGCPVLPPTTSLFDIACETAKAVDAAIREASK